MTAIFSNPSPIPSNTLYYVSAIITKHMWWLILKEKFIVGPEFGCSNPWLCSLLIWGCQIVLYHNRNEWQRELFPSEAKRLKRVLKSLYKSRTPLTWSLSGNPTSSVPPPPTCWRDLATGVLVGSSLKMQHSPNCESSGASLCFHWHH